MFAAGDEDGDEDREAEEQGIEEPGNNAHSADACQATSHQQLGAIGDNALDETRGSVQQRGTTARVDIEAFGYTAGYITNGKDGDCVVSRTDIGKANECADTEFGAGGTLDTAVLRKE